MAEIHSVSKFEPKRSHNYFIDANILLYLFAPIGDYKADMQQKIARFIEQARNVGAGMVVTSMVISEFYNKNIKDAFLEWQQQQSDSQKLDLKKHYRQSTNFKTDSLAIQSAIRAIYKLADRFPDDFSAININSVFANSFHADFNDAYFLTQANNKQWMIFSNDRDLINHPHRTVDVITAL